MGILDSIVGWIAEQVMNILDLITGSVLGALGCDISSEIMKRKRLCFIPACTSSI